MAATNSLLPTVHPWNAKHLVYTHAPLFLPPQGTATALRSQLRDVSVGLAGSDLSDGAARERWLVVARRLGESYLRLEKYVNINYAGLQKILKKHDKMLPEAPCAHFYKVCTMTASFAFLCSGCGAGCRQNGPDTIAGI